MNEEEVGTLVKAVQDNSRRLGLTWELTQATVTQSVPLKIKFDGDEDSHLVENALEISAIPGDRVYVMQVPPAGNYVMGYVNRPKMYTAVYSVAVAQSSVVFANIPAVRKLELTWTARSDAAVVAANLRMRINGDASAVYNNNFTQQNNVTITASVVPGATFWQIGVCAGNTATVNNFGSGHVTIPGWNAYHRNVNSQHTSHFYEAAATSWYEDGGGLYFAADPYTRVDIFLDTGNLMPGSEFLLTGAY